MTPARAILFTVATPYPALPNVTLFADTWQNHIVPQRPYLLGHADWLSGTLAAPSAVCAGTTNPGYLAFVSGAIVSSGRRSPFVVFVDPIDRIVVTAGYRIDYRDLGAHTVLWVP